MRGIHEEYNLLRGRQIKINFLREMYFGKISVNVS